uniref:C3H1-type domain-containing protein n=2 Tax=Panagrolaimus sp. JU765 TaxID=591449 RepID=A0AC34QV73_9BILA
MASMTENNPDTSMTDNSLNEKPDEEVDMEEGELPEEGEIMDDEDDEHSSQTENKAPSSQRSEPSTVRSSDSNKTISNDTTTSTNSYDSSSRKRPASPTVEPSSPKQFAHESSPNSAPQLPPRRRQPWTEAVLCKFFREGYCRDGNNCAYSHDAAHSNRKPELCKFYQQGYCKKGLACNLLHGEYPCKAFHEGKCDKNPCKYSHMPLNDYTKVIFEQMVQDEALASQIVIPQAPQRRKVLLPRPPPTAAAVPTPAVAAPVSNNLPANTSSPDNNVQVQQVPVRQPLLPAPVVKQPPVEIVKDILDDPDEKLVIEEAAAAAAVNGQDQVEQARNQIGGFSFGSMLQEMSTNTDKSEVPENNQANISPQQPATNNNQTGETWRSPTTSTPEEKVVTKTPQESNGKKPIYRLIPLAETDTDYDFEFLQKITSERFKNDPRIQSILKSQFERTSSMFGQNLPTIPSIKPDSSPQHPGLVGPSTAAAPVKVEKLGKDPRVRPTDPRLRNGPPLSNTPPLNPVIPAKTVSPIPQSSPVVVPQLVATNFDVHSGVPLSTQPVAALDDDVLKSLAEKHIQMMNSNTQRPNNGPQPQSAYEPRNSGFSNERYSTDDRYYDDTQSYSSPPNRYNNDYDRRDYPPPGPKYDRYDDYGYEEDYRRQAPPMRGRGRGGYYETDRREYRGNRPNDRFEPRYDNRNDSYRRDNYRNDRERKDYPRSSRYRDRSRSRSPRNSKPEPMVEDRPMTLREKRKNNEYQSPLARA